MAEDKSGYEIALERIAAVRESMGTDEEIYELDLSQLNLKEIPSEISILKRIIKLNFSNNNLSKISGLDSLDRLEKLILYNNKIESINGVQKLEKLKELILNSNQIRSIGSLDSLVHLEKLDLGGNLIEKIENLEANKGILYLVLFSNYIKKIENLEKLVNLTSLDLSQNYISEIENLDKLTYLAELYLTNNQISKIQNLDKLTKLYELHLDSNQIKKIENLECLSNLILLSLDLNQISKIENLDKLTKLLQLNLTENQIYKIENIDKLIKLRYLKIDRNKIENFSEISSEFITQIKRQHLGVKINDNPFIGKDGISNDDYSDGYIANHSVQLITDYKYLNSEKIKVKIPSKIVLYGNSNVGKSFLSYYLKTNTIPVRKESTEILKIDHWKEGDIDAYIYDFGGQDFYHATYQMFFTIDTIYSILWDDGTNHNKRNDAKTEERPDAYYNYNVAYWLANVNYHFKHIKDNKLDKKQDKVEYNSEHIHINLIKNKIDLPNIISSHSHVMEALRDYPVDQSYELMLDLTDESNYIRKRTFFREELMSQISKYQNSITMNSHRAKAIDVILNIRKKKGHKSIFIEDLWKQTFEDQHKDEDLTDLKSVLRTLHNRGLILWYGKNQLEEKVWLRPDKVIEHIHSVLMSMGIGKFKGSIPKAEFEKKFADLKELMLIQNISFFDAFSANYVIPQFLSEQSNNDILFELAQDGLEILFAVQFNDFMPHGLFNRLACFFGGLPDQKYYVKNKMIFTLNSVKVWLEIDPLHMRVIFKAGNTKSKEAAELQMYLFRSLVAAYWGYNPMVFKLYRFYFPKGHNIPRNIENNKVVEAVILDGSGNKLQHEDWASTQEEKNLIVQFKLNVNSKNIMEVYNNIELNFPSGMKVSLDNIYFADYKELVTVFENHKDHNNYVLLHNQIYKDNSRKMYAAPFNPFMNKPLPVPKKLFISYSSKNSDFMKRFTLHLESLRTEGLISYWTDRMIDTGAAWDEKIQMELDQADRVIYLLCPYFLITPYIMEKELSKGFKKEEVKPGSIQFIHLQHCNWKIHSKLTECQHLLDPTIAGKKLVVVENAMNDEVWVKIIEDLRNILKDKH